MVKIVCWNLNRSADACTELRQMDVDVALLQEVGKGAAQRMADILGEAETWDWEQSNAWPAVARLSDRVKVDVFTPVAPEGGGIKRNTIAVSDRRTLAAARVTPLDGKRTARAFLVFSLYARWLNTHPQAKHSTSRRGGAPSASTPMAPLTEPSLTCPRSSATRILRRTGCWWLAT